ncbi:hypothetical protein [Candidatus Solirubrobacter pratensis]|uniref:hypothetical protein n=1 Tax=Candidatus Solirubrobacter pratensis TaxID=1298857 RepID=UPI00042274E6|nr:hypothetical protein [Candidatus Solirubrobacter pratensis]
MDAEEHHRWWKQTGRRHVNQILHDDWNPIGFELPDDEYSSYAATVGRLLREGAGADEVSAFLANAREHMGLQREDVDDRTDRRIATSLRAWYRDRMRERE